MVSWAAESAAQRSANDNRGKRHFFTILFSYSSSQIDIITLTFSDLWWFFQTFALHCGSLMDSLGRSLTTIIIYHNTLNVCKCKYVVSSAHVSSSTGYLRLFEVLWLSINSTTDSNAQFTSSHYWLRSHIPSKQWRWTLYSYVAWYQIITNIDLLQCILAHHLLS